MCNNNEQKLECKGQQCAVMNDRHTGNPMESVGAARGVASVSERQSEGSERQVL